MIRFEPGDIYARDDDDPILQISMKDFNPTDWKQQILDNQEKAERLAKIDQFLQDKYACTPYAELTASILFEQWEDELHESEQLEQENKQLKEIVDRLRKFIGHQSQLFLDNKLDNQSITMLVVLRNCVLNGKFDDSTDSWKEVLTTQERADHPSGVTDPKKVTSKEESK